MTLVSELDKKWAKKPKYAKAFAELAPDYAVARLAIATGTELTICFTPKRA